MTVLDGLSGLGWRVKPIRGVLDKEHVRSLVSRRVLLGDALTAGGMAAVPRVAAAGESSQITRVKFGPPVRYNRPGRSVIGDTGSCAWADDVVVYTVIDDMAGFDMTLRPSRDRNVAIGSFGTLRPPELESRMTDSPNKLILPQSGARAFLGIVGLSF